MKKIMIIFWVLLLTGCSTTTIEQSITDDKFDITEEIHTFDIEAYIEKLDPIINDMDYIRLTNIRYEEDQNKSLAITDKVSENILQIFNDYEKNHGTYELVNFLDFHIQKLSEVEVDIILFKLIQRIEADYENQLWVVEDAQFGDIIVDYMTKITDSFIESFEVTPEILNEYPNIYQFLEKLGRIVDGGYQIRRYDGAYYVLLAYGDILVPYKDYLSEETLAAVEILIRDTRNIVWINDIIQVDNEAIAYKANEVEGFLKSYPNSVYYPMMRDYYVSYLEAIVGNPDNVIEVAANTYHYDDEAIQDLRTIAERYSESQMAGLIEDLILMIENEEKVYDEEKVNDFITRIRRTY